MKGSPIEEWIPICIELRGRIQELQLKFFSMFFHSHKSLI